ncbi:MAG: putative replicase protein [Alehxovirus infecundadaptatum]|uniref:RNA-directed RNA polymerase n=1 Tax=Leviviridae sp. TaxID=2027243 RepID=A0ABY3STY2_9VIRU|nr:MAG: putative replicase protein [Leviviridae sp.]
MTKRHVTMVQNAYRDILVDISVNVPEASGLGRDFMRLCSAVEERGLKFFTIDLPDMGKHFDRCLSNSRLTISNLAHQRPYKKGVVIPRLFKGLLLRVFDRHGSLLSEPCIRSIRALRQLYNLAKKLKIQCEEKKVYDSVTAFFETDRGIISPSLDWSSDYLDCNGAHHLCFDDKLRPQYEVTGHPTLDLREEFPRLQRYDVRAIHFALDTIAISLGLFDPKDWRNKHGPGAVSDRIGRSKYDFPHWPKKLDNIFPIADFAFANYSLWADDVGVEDNRFRDLKPPCKLIAVPKTQKGPRLIASEPICNQWIQQLIKDFLYERVRRTWIGSSIHFRDQKFNQEAARRASISGSHWTIDLSEASDRVSCYVVERAFRQNPCLLQAFHACRTESIINTIDSKQPKISYLRKFSTMGSALTFPVQSLVFLGIVLGCMLSHRNLELSQRNVRKLSKEVLVFGDDLIVPSDVGYLVLGALRYLGFKVNHMKTYGRGNFRESCGGEYYKGHDVTPVYLLTYPDRRRPESIVSSVQTRNNFYKRGYFTLADDIQSTIRHREKISLPVVPVDSGILGWESFLGLDLSGLKTRFNRNLHRREVWVHKINSRVTRSPDRYSSRLLQYFTERPLPVVKWEGGVIERPSSSLRRGWVATS